MFIYYSLEQAQAVAEEERQLALFKKGLRTDKPNKTEFRGPDAFLVKEALRRDRKIWVAWEEDNRLPDLILELLSPSTADDDYGVKKGIYQDVFKTSEYFLYTPQSEAIDGFRLLDNSYQPIVRSPERRLWSRELEVEIGIWNGQYEDVTGPWLRLFHPDGRLVPTKEERVELGVEQGVRQGKAELLKSLASQRFNELPQGAAERFDQADVDTLDRWCRRLLDAGRLEDVFDD